MPPGKLDPEDSPYLGPSTFDEGSHALFFGRDAETERLTGLIEAHRSVLVYGRSGVGKSSLLNAAVGKRLAEAGYEVLRGARVGSALPVPADRLPEGANTYTVAALCSLDESRQGAEAYAGMSLLDYFQARRPRSERGTVLFLDQFEELFTRSHGSAAQVDRVGFFAQLRALLDQMPTVRVVISFREEHLASVERLWGTMREEGERFHLEPLGRRAAEEAVRRPAEARGIRFDEGVAAQLVEELARKREVNTEGELVFRTNAPVQPVQLQVVCDRLWRLMTPGLGRITEDDLADALSRSVGGADPLGPGDGLDQKVRSFVAEAMTEFYLERVESATTALIDLQMGSLDRDTARALVHLGLVEFVTPLGTRALLPQGPTLTGRLPNQVVDHLCERRVLRRERGGRQGRGEEVFVELVHDVLIEPIEARLRSDARLTAMWQGLNSLRALLERARAQEAAMTFGAEHAAILRAVEEFREQPGLFEEEAEFVLRCSLASGEQMLAWGRRVRSDHPRLVTRVLRSALESDGPAVRGNATRLVAELRLVELGDHLVAAALGDPAPEVRAQAARGLASLDRIDLYRRLLEKGAASAAARQALAILKDTRDARGGEHGFDEVWDGLGRLLRNRVRISVAGLRIRAQTKRLLATALLAPLTALPLAMALREGLASFGLTQSQHHTSLGIGSFHAIVGSVAWGLGTTLPVVLYWAVTDRGRPRATGLRGHGVAVAGAVGGLVAGWMMSGVVAGVFSVESLERAGWLSPTRGWDTGFLWMYPVLGMSFGFGAALMARAYLREGDAGGPTRFSRLAASQRGRFNDWRECRIALWECWKTSFRYALAPAVTIAVGCAIVLTFLEPGEAMTSAYRGRRILKTACESLSIWSSSIGSVAGMAFAFLMLRKGAGFTLEPEEEGWTAAPAAVDPPGDLG